MNDQLHILISGRDADLLSTRALVLRSKGYRVSETLQEVQHSVELPTIDLLIVCHTLTAEERAKDLSTLMRASGRTKALCLTPHTGARQDDVATLDSFAGPYEMLRVVNGLLPSSRLG